MLHKKNIQRDLVIVIRNNITRANESTPRMTANLKRKEGKRRRSHDTNNRSYRESAAHFSELLLIAVICAIANINRYLNAIESTCLFRECHID